MKYGQKPATLGTYFIETDEMFFYQDMPIKLAGSSNISFEPRIKIYWEIISAAMQDFIELRSLEELNESYVYISAKRMFIPQGTGFNRPGWHADGFMTDDINYIWSDEFPTIFNLSDFNIPKSPQESLVAMETQAVPENDYTVGKNDLVRLDQFCIHRTAEVTKPVVRNFFKLSISKEKYDLSGNTHNYLLSYKWDMRPRNASRNTPTIVK